MSSRRQSARLAQIDSHMHQRTHRSSLPAGEASSSSAMSPRKKDGHTRSGEEPPRGPTLVNGLDGPVGESGTAAESGDGGEEDSNVRVVVRVRPMSAKERSLHAQCILKINGQQISIVEPDSGKARAFSFDNCFNSMDGVGTSFATQSTVHESVGAPLVDNAWQGYNVTVFACT